MRFKTRSEAALCVWDYFYISKHAQPGDEQPWRAIERATIRILESEPYLDAPNPPDVRLKSARRVRNAARAAMREIERLSERPETWVIEQLARFAALAAKLVESLAESARALVLH